MVEKIQETSTETKFEELSNVNYKKDYVSFVIKPLHIDLCHRWSKWCDDHGFSKMHNKAFAFALDLLENKSTDLINANKRLDDIEKLLNAHDKLIESFYMELYTLKENPVDDKKEQINSVLEQVRKKREMMGGKK